MTITENDLLTAICEDMPQPLRPDEITAQMVADRTGCAFKTAKNHLDEKVRLGELYARKARLNGKFTTAYGKKSRSQPG